MIEIRNISKSYQMLDGTRKTVLRNFSLSIDNKMNIGILGRNGAGKSTILKLICGLEMPDSGEIITNSRKISWPLGGGAGVHGSLTGRENIRFISKIYDMDFQTIFDFVESYAELKEYMDMPVKTYSSGMKGRLSFGISMAVDFDTYLIDEGFSAGDTNFRLKTMEMFDKKKLKANVILVSHNPKIVRRMCNKVAILNSGQIKIYEDIEEGIKIYNSL